MTEELRGEKWVSCFQDALNTSPPFIIHCLALGQPSVLFSGTGFS